MRASSYIHLPSCTTGDKDFESLLRLRFRRSRSNQAIQKPGLEDVIRIVEHPFQEQIDEARDTIRRGSITVEALGGLYRPGVPVQTVMGSGDTAAAFLVSESFYQENRGLTGVQTTFNWTMEFVASMGTHFTAVNLTEQLNGWTGVRVRLLSKLTYTPVSSVELSELRHGGKRYVEFAIRGVKFLAYSRASFYRHVRPSRPSYFLLPFIPYCWPALVGFSFTAKSWGHVLVSGLIPIQFQDNALQRFVLAEEYRHLIRALVKFGNDASVEDIVENKRSGSIFLLHGPPGVGKTLTAEAVAEVLHRPLYYVTIGESGTTAEEMERRPSDVLELCSQWNATIVLDEADVFLEQRRTSDLVRNSMVFVMLRLLEYHSDILFLNTNCVRNLDPAFKSRITLALRYNHLTPEARAQIWNNLLKQISLQVAKSIDHRVLGQHEFNGRQIKGAITKERDQSVLTTEIVKEVVRIMEVGRTDIADDDPWKMRQG
ncbi:hypothetical protein AG0111_0g7942 [Alternaria gaisen]|uniref:Uncharacterized protein n=1 Tax=Alternaria gaisen TaxID=167740 RepID=A0ACB6FHJ7_9PLEO|nr:hypothetical protein AG0111_0g7942 [Alternaria gaisen]